MPVNAGEPIRPRTRLRYGIVGLVLASIAMSAGGVARAQSPPQFPDGPLEVTDLTNTDAAEFQPAWSPDGTWIAYMRDDPETGVRSIWSMDADGTDQQQVTQPSEGESDQYPDISPDGSTIAFTRFTENGEGLPADTWTVDRAGTTETQLTVATGDEQYREAVWSPDGAKLALGSNVDGAGAWGIFTMDPDGLNLELVFRGDGGNEYFDGEPDWSADGQTLYFTRWTATDPVRIASVPASGGVPTDLISEDPPVFGVFGPSASSDGGHLAYDLGEPGPDTPEGDPTEIRDVYVANSDGTDRVNVTPFPTTEEVQPAYAPDGTRLAFTGNAGGRRDIFCVGEPGACAGPQTGTSESAGAGGTVSTNSGTDAEDPVGTSVTTPVAGPVTILEGGTTTSNPDGFSLLGEQVDITAPDATPADPLVLSFRLDSSVLPDGTAISSLEVFRNGTAVPDCDAGSGGAASPDPCVASRIDDGGDAVITVRTSQASSWNFGRSDVADSTAPTITLTTPAEDAVYTLGQQVAADYSCADEDGGSGLASCTGDVASGQPIDTSSVGAKTFTVEATDNAGNPASVTHDYNVIYDFAGFFTPVANPPALNRVKPGDTVPLKFSLAGNRGLGILAAGSPTSHQITCSTGARSGGDEGTVPTGSTGLSYQAKHARYTYDWQTKKSWLNTCRQFVLALNDGTDHVANFSFQR